MISRLLLIGALLAPLICHAGADRFAQERNPSVAQSFTPPITPGITGSPGANKYLYSNALGVVGWGSLPIAAAGVYRKIGLVFPQTGAGSWRISGVEW